MRGKRFLERKDIKRLIGQAQDFTIRWRGLHVLTVGSSIILSLVSLVLLWTSYSNNSLSVAYALPLFLSFCVSLVLIFSLHQCFTRVTYIEFLSLLFASSARIETEFLMILNRRGIVVYCDDNYDRLFKNLPDIRDFQEFLALDGIKKEHADQVTKALMEREAVEVPFDYKGLDGEKVGVTLKLEPLSRPQNYNVLRAIKRH